MPKPSARADTVKAVAERFGVGAHTVLAWIASGELRALNCARSATARKPRWRIPVAAIEAFEAKRTAAANVQTPRRGKAKAEGVVQFY